MPKKVKMKKGRVIYTLEGKFREMDKPILFTKSSAVGYKRSLPVPTHWRVVKFVECLTD